jgi:hypothetical protein
MYSNMACQRLRLGLFGTFSTVSVWAPTEYDRVQKRQYTGQMEVARGDGEQCLHISRSGPRTKKQSFVGIPMHKTWYLYCV